MFDTVDSEMFDQMKAVFALARICQISLADLNARAYSGSRERARLNASIDRAIKANRKAYQESLASEIEKGKKG